VPNLGRRTISPVHNPVHQKSLPPFSIALHRTKCHVFREFVVKRGKEPNQASIVPCPYL
jgi:hypothetical protein